MFDTIAKHISEFFTMIMNALKRAYGYLFNRRSSAKKYRNKEALDKATPFIEEMLVMNNWQFVYLDVFNAAFLFLKRKTTKI